jgi:hypothetical protein
VNLFAWNKAGNMATGAIAYYELAETDSDVLDAVLHLLEAHPEYETRFEPLLGRPYVPEADRDLYLFMLAARWADDVRGDHDFDRPLWHYINLPFKPAGQPGSVQTGGPEDGNLELALEENIAVFIDSTRDEQERAVALTWLFHLFGDVHQPLHTARIFTTTFPDGDRGGTRFYVKPTPSGGTVSLHGLWDGLVIGSQRLRSVRNKVTQLRADRDLERQEFSDATAGKPREWIEESFDFAKGEAYKDGDLRGSRHEHSGEPLPDGYLEAAKKVAEARLVLACYRLTDFLVEHLHD